MIIKDSAEEILRLLWRSSTPYRTFYLCGAGFIISGVCGARWDPHIDGVDVAGVSGEGLLAGPFPQVPQLGQRVTGSRDEGVLVLGESQRHAVSNVVGEDDLLLASLQVPQTAGRKREEERYR